MYYAHIFKRDEGHRGHICSGKCEERQLPESRLSTSYDNFGDADDRLKQLLSPLPDAEREKSPLAE